MYSLKNPFFPPGQGDAEGSESQSHVHFVVFFKLWLTCCFTPQKKKREGVRTSVKSAQFGQRAPGIQASGRQIESSLHSTLRNERGEWSRPRVIYCAIS